MLRVRMFGGLVLAWNHEPLPTIPGTAARSLFAYLVTYRDRPHTRDLLAGTFWSDLPDATARRRLSKALWQIRHAFRTAFPKRDKEEQDRAGPLSAVLVTQGDTLQLNPDLPVWVDKDEFEQQIIYSSHERFSQAADGLLRAIDLYRGEFLAGYYHDWSIVERERLHGILLEVLSRLVAGYKGRGEYELALRFARQLVAEEPRREGAHREVMQLCHLLGEDAGALKQFEICRQSLVAELGTEPSSETVALADEIAIRSGLSRPPLLPASARSVTIPLLERPDQLPLVGRRKELAELLHQVEASTEGTGGLTIVYGEAGVGKSRLLLEVAENARWRGVRTALGRCYELAAPPAYQPLVEALRANLSALSKSSLEPLWRAELSRILPELASGEVPLPPMPPEEEKRRLLEAIVQGFLALVDTAPHLVSLEDAQWMDPASLEVLRYLLPRLGEAPLLVVVTARPEELRGPQAEILSTLESTRSARRLELGRLSQAETEKLVQRALDLEEPVPIFSHRLYAETEGNPFFLIETLRALVEEKLLYRDEAGDWSTQWDESTEDYAELPLPAGVVQSIERRLDRLPRELSELLELAAVIGRGVDFTLWRAASRRDEADVLRAGDELCSRGLLLAADPTAAGSQDYVFSHDQIRRVTYRRLARPQRRLYHRKVAQALADLTRSDPATLAYHWTQAEVWDRAVEWHRQAGDRAASVYAHAEAADHYTQALAALEARAQQTTFADPARRFDLHLAREAVYALEGKRTAQAKDLARLEALAEQLEDGRPRTAAALRQGKWHADIGDHPAALEQLERALTLARVTGDQQLEASGLAALGDVHLHLGDFTESLTYRAEALAIFRTLGDRQQEARSLSACGTLHLLMGYHSLAQDYCERALALCRATGDQQGEARSLHTLSRILSVHGDLLRAQETLLRALNITRATGDRHREAYFLLELGNHYYKMGDYQAAREALEQTKAIFLQIDEVRGHGYALADLSLVYQALGNDDMAVDCCTQGRDLLRTVGDRWGEAGCYQHLGLVMEALGDLGSAADVYTQASVMNEKIKQPARVLENRLGVARVALTHGRLTEALEPVEDMVAWINAEGIQSLEFPFVAYMTVHKVLAAAGDLQRARRLLTEAYDTLMGRAEKLEDPSIRDLYLESVAIHREIVVAYRDLQASQQVHRITVSLPRVDAPLGRPLREDEFVAVAWTVAEPEDGTIAGKVARRRHRILRLLQEAQDQGAAPTHSHLAEALGVSRRTIERDMAALDREQPDLPPTRGKMSE